MMVLKGQFVIVIGLEKVKLMLDPNAKMVLCFWIEFLRVYKLQIMEGIDTIKINESKHTPCGIPQKHHISVIAAPSGKYIVEKMNIDGRCLQVW